MSRSPRRKQKSKRNESSHEGKRPGPPEPPEGYVSTVASVQEQPVVRVMRWRVFSIGEERCLYGCLVGTVTGRRSSWIRSIDPEQMRVRTASGRIYELVGPPGYDDNAQYLLELDLILGLPLKDVTERVCQENGLRWH